MAQQEIVKNSFAEITASCAKVVSYFHLASNISPIKRLYIKNLSDEDRENITVRVSSEPEFLLPTEITGIRLPRRTTAKFDADVKLSPLYLVALDRRVDGEIVLEVLDEEGVSVTSERFPVELLAFNECNCEEDPGSLAAFVRRTQELNKLLNLAARKLQGWELSSCVGYSGTRNNVRNHFAACYSVLADKKFTAGKGRTDGEYSFISDHSETMETGIASPLELALILAAMVEANGQNAVIARISGKWFAGCFLVNECLPNLIGDDVDMLRKKSERGVSDLSFVCVQDILDGIAFEKAEKTAQNALRKAADVDFIVDIKRARIMHIYPLPERVKREGGYDLRQSKDYYANVAPKQLSEYGGEIGGEKEISRVTQWERRLLDMDMRNSLLNFKVSQTVVKLLVPSLEDFIENVMGDVHTFTLEQKPKENLESLDKLSGGFDRVNFLKPFADYILYEYKNRRFRTVYENREHESVLLRLFRKERSIQEETGTLTLYLAAGFLKWKEQEHSEEKFAPLFLYPVTINRKGIASPSYSVEVNTDDLRVNSTLLEFLYQEFDLDMRGLTTVALDSPQAVLSVLARIKRETVRFKGWDVLGNVFLASLSFANYLLWHDVKYKPDRFREHPIVSSLINNRLELPPGAFDLSDRSSDEAYIGNDRMFLPISADSSQYSAIYDSLSKSFVLHGPPGTGKSQTITNIIANNIVRGRRVLFVAEKMAALSVVHRRLQNIGLGDFCLELHSNKANKNVVLNHIINTLSLADSTPALELEEKAAEIAVPLEKLQKELDAMHRKRYLGFSLYEAILNYFANEDAPDCLNIDSLFYEKLTESSFNNYLEVLTELSLRAKECGDIEKSPFRHIGGFTYDEKWRRDGESILEIYLIELKHLRQYARNLLPLFNMRTVALTGAKLGALYDICKLLKLDCVQAYFMRCKTVPNAKGVLDSFREAQKKHRILTSEYADKYGTYPYEVPLEELSEAVRTGNASRAVRKCMPQNLEKKDRALFFEFLEKCETNRRIMMKRKDELASLFAMTSSDLATVGEHAETMADLFSAAAKLYADFDLNLFNESCIELTKYGGHRYIDFFVAAYDNCARAGDAFSEIFRTGDFKGGDDIGARIDYVTNVQKNIDFIPNWCRYQEMVEKCRQSGFDFILEPLDVGEISAADILRCFKKCVYHNFIRSELYLDDVLCQFSGLNLEEAANKFKALTEEYERLTRQELYRRLVASLPRADTTGDHNLERVILMRAEKTNMKGTTLRGLFAQIPNVLKACCPCMLMSPTSVSQFLDIDMDKFDLVIFDEASQVPTCKAVGSIVRGKNVIVVGDPKQLPPTTFFSSDYRDDEHYETEDLESILDDCLALGMPENHLLWHYRSNHESLIAFSNAMYYDNTLLTFPSPNELSSKVSFVYVDGVYERGGSKCNRKEGDALVAEVIKRLKDPALRTQSIGIVTFNTAQQNYIENELSRLIHAGGLDAVAYDCEEPLFVKNLESVQGDERDVILFSVGYGPDSTGKLSLNFGPINQAGGYKRLNVAVTRARNEMKVFSGITGNMIDLNRTDSKGVAGLKAFLEYAERGRDMLAINLNDITPTSGGIGELVAAELKDRGILCDYNLGVSDFKIDVAVVDPRNKDKYILAIICDSESSCKLKGVKDRVAMQTKILKKLGWNTYQLWTVNFFNNTRREITKIKDYITTLTEKKVMSKKLVKDITNRYRVPYKSYYCKPMVKAGAEYVLNFVNEEKIKARIRDVIETESPIESSILLDKLLVVFNVPKTAKRAVAALSGYIEEFASFRQEFDGKVFYVDKPVETFRPSDVKVTRDLTKVHPGEIIAAAKCAAETRLNLLRSELPREIIALFGTGKKTKPVTEWIDKCIEMAIAENQLLITVDDIVAT